MSRAVSSNRIDKFIEAMHKKRAEHLLFSTGTPVRIRVDGVEKVILDKEVRTDQIVALLEPAALDRRAELERPGEHQFSYAAPTGRVHVRVLVQGERLSVIVSPETSQSARPIARSEISVDLGSAVADEESRSRTGPQPRSRPGMELQPRLPASALTPLAEEAPEPPSAEPPRRPAGSGLDALLQLLFDERGSDLHLSTHHRPMMRKDGDIQPIAGFDDVLSSETIEGWVMGVAHEAARRTFKETNDADFAHEIPGVARFRMNVFRDRLGVGLVARTIPTKILTADELGLPPVIRSFCELPKGLVVVTGPTGSGKSTTLAAMIDLINKTRSDHIITIEDPVEFVHPSQRCLVNQREVQIHTRSFATALRAALREDPDIVLVGELRDLETVHIAIETAETGHLVFGTLHTNTAPSTVDRIIDQFPTDHQAQIRVMLSESLKGVVAQTLCKKIGGGRVACLEILVVTNAISNLIREGKTFQIPSIMQTSKGQGMQTQQDAMLALVKNKVVAPQEAINKAVDQGAMRSALERAGLKPES